MKPRPLLQPPSPHHHHPPAALLPPIVLLPFSSLLEGFIQQGVSLLPRACSQDAELNYRSFHFLTNRRPLDWRLLHSVDVDAIVSKRRHQLPRAQGGGEGRPCKGGHWGVGRGGLARGAWGGGI